MSLISSLTKEDLINVENESLNYESFFEDASKTLLKKGYVKESFYKAILEREKKYPTGLELPKITIAIPHTDTEHVNEPFIFINKMKEKNIEFTQMGTDDVFVKPEFIIILGIKEPKEQVGLLSSMMSLFDNESFVNEIRNSNSIEDMYKIFKEQ